LLAVQRWANNGKRSAPTTHLEFFWNLGAEKERRADTDDHDGDNDMNAIAGIHFGNCDMPF